MTTAPPPEYPAAWELDAVLADGGTVHVRPIRPDDGLPLVAFHSSLSAGTVYLRFFAAKPHLTEADVRYFTHVDYSDRMAFVATLDAGIVAVGRYERIAATDDAEVAFVVADAHQGRGLGSLLLEYLAAVARENGITRFIADALAENRRMLDVFQNAGFREAAAYAQGVVRVTLDIEPTGASIGAIERREWTAGVRSMERLLRPRSVAVVGAGRDPRSIGHEVLRNLVAAGFTGLVYPINPNAAEIAGVPAFPSVDAVPGGIDVAIVCIPAATVPEVVDACAAKGVHGLVVISAGFAEAGEDGLVLQRALVERAHRGGMRVVGPNCLGVINTDARIRLNATFASRMPIAGNVGFASQSGALGIALLERSQAMGLGISSFVSMGNRADVSGNDLLRFWGQDGATQVVLLYLESFGNPRKFARVAPAVSRNTPIVAVKSGRSAAGARAPASHTAAMATPDVAVDALFRQAGVIRVETLQDLLDCGSLLAHQPTPRGVRVAIVGNAGGAGILAADACPAAGLEVPELDVATQDALRRIAGANAGVSNPVDLGAGAGARTFREALAAVLAADAVDAAVVILAPVPHVTAADVARAVAEVPADGRPVVFVHLASDEVPSPLRQGVRTIPCFAFPEQAVRTLGRVAEHARWRARPAGSVPVLTGVDVAAGQRVIDAFLTARPQGGWLDPAEAAALLGAYRIPMVAARRAGSAAAAVAAARSLAAPVALKVVAEGIIHKSDVGGVRLGLRTAADVRRAYREMASRLGSAMRGAVVQAMVTNGVETIVGVVHDPVFGPLVMFGSGGVAVELLGDRVFRILPLTDVDAAEVVRSIRGAPLLLGHRGRPVCDVAALEDLLHRVGRLAEEVPQLAEMDLNPVMALPDGVVVVDSRIRVLPWTTHPEQAVRRLG